MGIHAITKTYDGFFENSAVDLAPIFHSREGRFLRRRFLEIRKWMTNYERNGEKPPQQAQRNASAHRCGVGSVYEKHENDHIRRIQFILRTFWDNLDEWLPKLKPECDDIIDMLRQDLPGIPEPLDGPSFITIAAENKKNSDDFAKTSYEPIFWFYCGTRILCEFINGIFECIGAWFGRKWKQVCELWREEEEVREPCCSRSDTAA
jgi:hypothetical protein